MPEKKSSLLHKGPGMVWGKDEYKTARGGGTPTGEENAFGKGVKNHPEGKGREGYKKAGEPGGREPDQPRDAEGHFTYNSMIGKELKEISKKNGKSRGTTVPPMFNGGVNGPHSEGEKFDEELFEEWRGNWYNKGFEKGGEVAVAGAGWRGGPVIKIAPNGMIEVAREWIKDEKGEVSDQFGHKEYAGRGRGRKSEKVFEGDMSKWETKKGRPTGEESEAKKRVEGGSRMFVPVREPEADKAGMFGEKILDKDYVSPAVKEARERIEGEVEEARIGREGALSEAEAVEVFGGKELTPHQKYSFKDVQKASTINPMSREEFEKMREGFASPNAFDKAFRKTAMIALGMSDEEEVDYRINTILKGQNGEGIFRDPIFLKNVLEEYDEERA